MKKTILTAAFSLFAAIVISCGGKSVNANIIEGSTAKFDSLSYAIGIDMANGVKRNLGNIKFNLENVKKGVRTAALSGKSLTVGDVVLDKESTNGVLRDFFMTTYRERSQKLRAKEFAANDSLKAVNDTLDFNTETMFASDEEQELISTAFGYDVGTNLARNSFPVHLVWFLQALDDVENNAPKMDERAAGDYLRYYFTEKLPADNKKASQEWLAKVETESGVQKTESGLLYKIIEAGDASSKPAATDTVKVHYKGTTRDGKVFDASRFADMPEERQKMLKQYRPDTYSEDNPIEFPLNGVIRGWTEGLQLIGKGGKVILWIPAELAYGERGAGANIGPNEALRFEVDLLDVMPKAQAPAAPTAE